MSKRTDEALFKIVNGPEDDYQPAAFEAAKKEFAKRNLSIDQLTSIKQEVENDEKINNDKATEPLGSSWKVLTFLFPGIIQIIFSGTFKADGYDRKAKELVRWTIYGIGFYVGLIILLSLLDAIL